jgi:CheY-like chemotaxis protein
MLSVDVEAPRTVNSQRKLRILVVDDNDGAAESLALILGLFGHEVRVAHDGPSAVAEVEAWRPEAVFLDIALPGGMDGWEAARVLRAAWGPALRLIALTGCGEEEDRRRGLAAGFDDYLVKPAGVEDLEKALRDCPR